MSPDRWQKIEEAYHAALERERNGRNAFLAEACNGDDELRREVESLLAQETQAEQFLEMPALKEAAKALAENQSRSLIGQQLGTYTIVSLLGAGGMGEVYQAHDIKLGRDVAIKVLPSVFTHDPERLSRFQREARMLAALNHPNIATIYGLEHADGVHYLVMELVPGETLAERISKGAMPLQEALKIAGEMAEGLEAAHGKGVIHRDLKPANVKVTQEGRVKVLDFGLAKTLANRDADLTQAPTVSQEGRILGTPAYMSPEQVRGEALDARTDLFSFGVVLYEMVTGRRPFQGNTTAEVFGAILNIAPTSPAHANSGLPPKIEEIINKSLEKKRALRYQSAADIHADLRCLQRDTDFERTILRSAISLVNTGQWKHKKIALWIAAIVAVVLLAAVYLIRSKPNATVSTQREWIQLTDFADSAISPALSPDGRLLTFIRGSDTFYGPGQIYAKLLPDGEPVELTHDQLLKMSPQFSSDGSRITYTALRANPQWDTWVVPTLGGDARLMLPNASGLTWIDNRRLLFSEIKSGIHMGVVTANENRDEIRDIYLPPRDRGMAHRSSLSPDHKWVLLAEMDNGGWKPCRLVPFDKTSSGSNVGPPNAGCTYVAWSPDGNQMYFSSDAGGRFHIWRQQFPDGKPEQLTSGPTAEEGIAIAPDGQSLITSVGLRESTIWIHDTKGDRQISSESYAEDPKFSPDGKKLYYLIRRRGASATFRNGELWVVDLDTNHGESLLPGFVVTSFDISPDGERVAFSAADKQGRSHLWLAPIDRRSSPRPFPSTVSQDQPHFDHNGYVYFRAAEGNYNFLYRMKEDSTGLEKAISAPLLELNGISPDGKWAFIWNKDTSAYPIGGGPPITICQQWCPGGWGSDGQFFYVYLEVEGQTLLLPIAPGKDLPTVPRNGIGTRADTVSIAGVRALEGRIRLGRTLERYASWRFSVRRNLYRIPL